MQTSSEGNRTPPADSAEAEDRPAQFADVQKVAMRHLQTRRQPSLKSVSERWLDRTLDKTHQCSNWDLRPLSSAQVLYAAIDAAVLLDLGVALCIEPSDANAVLLKE